MDLINRIRACSFADGGCTIELGGRVYRLNLTMSQLQDETVTAIPGFRPEVDLIQGREQT